MFCRIARAGELLQRHKYFLRGETNEVIPEHLVALAYAKKRLWDINLSVATWLSDFMDFEDATRRILKLYVLSYCSRCDSAEPAQVIAPERYKRCDPRATCGASLGHEPVAVQRSVRGNLAA